MVVIMQLMLSALLSPFDFLPQSLNPILRAFVYIMLLVHLLVLVVWMAYTCPTMFKSNDENLRDRMQKAMKEKST
jgi:hypothetical protein